jgi:hypothetical protein
MLPDLSIPKIGVQQQDVVIKGRSGKMKEVIVIFTIQ